MKTPVMAILWILLAISVFGTITALIAKNQQDVSGGVIWLIILGSVIYVLRHKWQSPEG